MAVYFISNRIYRGCVSLCFGLKIIIAAKIAKKPPTANSGCYLDCEEGLISLRYEQGSFSPN